MTWCGRQVLAGAFQELPDPADWHELSLALEARIRPGTNPAPVFGTASAPDWIGAVPTTGVVGLGGWGLYYELEFASYRFDGWLVLDGLNPVFSMTTVRGLISGCGEPLRRAELRWDLRHDALAFLRSWRRDRVTGILRPGGVVR